MTDYGLLGGRYEVGELLGRGAMGQVWRGKDTVLHREVAIKTIDLASHQDPNVAARFRREAVTMAGISHPNVAAVYDAGTDGTTAFLVMELLHGTSLTEVLRLEGPYNFDSGAAIGRQVASALAAAHQAGVVHRDIKPGNVVFNKGVPKIVDFGIARLTREATESLTMPETAIGTASYMSPEQCMGHQIGPASDMYALGCLLFSMFAGRPPFSAESPLAVIRAQVSDLPPRLSQVRAGTPPLLDDLIAVLLHKDPQYRPDAGHVASVLSRNLSGPVPFFASGQGTGQHPLPQPAPQGYLPKPSGMTAAYPVRPQQPIMPAPAPQRRPSPPPRKGNGPTVAVIIAVILVTVTLGVVAYALTAKPDPKPSPGPTSIMPSPTPTFTPSPTMTRSTPTPTTPTPSTGFSPTKGQKRVIDNVYKEINKIGNDDARDALRQQWDTSVSNMTQDNLFSPVTDFTSKATELSFTGKITSTEWSRMLTASGEIYTAR